jgi:predicted metal-dependent phosphoesterase TrpH
MRADLHIHTTASDGRLTPAEVVELAASRGLDIIAITDHDSVEGVAPALIAAQDFSSLRVIPGLEISTDFPQGEIHLLGYFIDHSDPQLGGTLERLRGSRRRRAQKMIAKLREMDIHVEWQRILELAGDGSVGRLHIAQAMLKGGYISSIQQAFKTYIGHGCPAYVGREKMPPVEAIDLVVKAGGLPVLAHPGGIIKELKVLLPQLKAAGLVGIEVYCNGYAPEMVQRLLALADDHGLIPCGGSDYHGLGNSGEPMPGDMDVPWESVERLLALAGQWELDLTLP